MHRFHPRFVFCVPLVCVLAGACSDDTEASPGFVLDGGFGADAFGSGPTGTGTTVAVTIPPGAMNLGLGAYNPNPAVVSPGATVVWTNGDSVPHTVTSTTAVWDSGAIAPGGTFSRVFTTQGTFPYFCSIHGAAAMSGSVIVQ